MNLTEKIRICATCKKCKRDHRGVVCSLTDDKPTFENECPEYEPDEATAWREKMKDRESDDVTYDEGESTLPGARWFRTIGIFSFINTVTYFLGVRFLYTLFTTEMLEDWALRTNDIFGDVFCFMSIILLIGFFIWTSILTSKGYKYSFYSQDVR